LAIQDPIKNCYQTVMAAVKHLQGEAVTKIVDMEPRLIDRQNLNAPDVQAQLHPDLKKYLE
jgi:ABC-type sugar transport system substrate-binding protein